MVTILLLEAMGCGINSLLTPINYHVQYAGGEKKGKKVEFLNNQAELVILLIVT